MKSREILSTLTTIHIVVDTTINLQINTNIIRFEKFNMLGEKKPRYD